MNKGVESSMGVLMLIILWFNFKEEFVFGLSLHVHPTLILLLFLHLGIYMGQEGPDSFQACIILQGTKALQKPSL